MPTPKNETKKVNEEVKTSTVNKTTKTGVETAVKKTATKTTATGKTSASKASASTAKSTAPKKGSASKVVESKTEKNVVEKKNGKTKILIAGSEVMPYIGTGGLGEVIGSLPKSIMNANSEFDVRVVVPFYGDIKQEYKDKVQHVGHVFTEVAWRHQYTGVKLLEENGVKYYFIDNEYYFKRNGLYGQYDDLERFAFFSKSVLEIFELIDFYPDLIHCNDWQTALIPVYLKGIYASNPNYSKIKTMFTIHNIEYQGKYDMYLLGGVLGLNENFVSILRYNDCMNLVKGAITCCDMISTVSETYANEILSEEYSHGLHFVLRHNKYKLCGILNGIDYVSYDPTTDKSIFVNYDKDSLDKKDKNKIALQKMLNLPEDKSIPMIAVISRLVSHKGMDLIMRVIEEVLQDKVQFVVLGTGESQYENYFSYLDSNYVGKVRTIIGFNSDLSRKIYASSDIFLMPSKSEPCGLSQMIASRYATVPIVRETGGLYDSIKDFGIGEDGNGYTFARYNAHDMMFAIKSAVRDFGDKEGWKLKRERVFGVDFSWNKSAKRYIEVYNSILGKN